MTELPKIEHVKENLEINGEFLIEYEFDAFNEEYFNMLVRELKDYRVSEIRPNQKIWITSGINSKSLNNYVSSLVEHIISYNELRNNVFNQFLLSLDLTDIEGQLYMLREKLQSTNKWPKGKFEKWNYWSHGGDIEFDYFDNSSHFNIAMSNINCIKYWSIHRFVKGKANKSAETEFISNHKDEIPRMFDLLVLNKKMKAIRTPIYEKQYELIDNGA